MIIIRSVPFRNLNENKYFSIYQRNGLIKNTPKLLCNTIFF